MAMIAVKKRPRFSSEETHWKFAWLPTRVSETHLVWLGWYQRRMIVIAEGNWAGGFQFKWEYNIDGRTWLGELKGD